MGAEKDVYDAKSSRLAKQWSVAPESSKVSKDVRLSASTMDYSADTVSIAATPKPTSPFFSRRSSLRVTSSGLEIDCRLGRVIGDIGSTYDTL